MALGEDVGKVIITVVDTMTPRSLRVILLCLVMVNCYGWWLHEGHLATQDKVIQAQSQTIAEFKAETAKISLQLQFMTSKTEEGNAELKAIRVWLMNRGR